MEWNQEEQHHAGGDNNGDKIENMMKLVAQDGMRDNNVAVYYRVISILRQIYIWKLSNNTEVILINSKN